MTTVIWLPGLPPLSVNNAYKNTPHGRAPSREMKAWKRDAAILLRQSLGPADGLIFPHDGLMSMEIEFRQPHDVWFTRTGAPRKRDVSNAIKLVEDAVADYTGVDDCWYFCVAAKKIVSKNAGIQITITEMGNA